MDKHEATVWADAIARTAERGLDVQADVRPYHFGANPPHYAVRVVHAAPTGSETTEYCYTTSKCMATLAYFNAKANAH